MEITMTITVTAEQAEKVARLLHDMETAGNAIPQMRSSAPVQQTQPMPQQNAPVQQTAPQPNAPTAAPAYTIAQLQTACAPLMDAGKGPQLQQLVQSFGVATLMDVPASRYGEFANGLRQLGGVL